MQVDLVRLSEDITRFNERYDVDLDTGCWLLRSTRRGTYGNFTLGGRVMPAHRASYLMFNGVIPVKHVVDHLCAEKSCVNPLHLEAVTQKVNANRSRTHRRTGRNHLGQERVNTSLSFSFYLKSRQHLETIQRRCYELSEPGRRMTATAYINMLIKEDLASPDL